MGKTTYINIWHSFLCFINWILLIELNFYANSKNLYIFIFFISLFKIKSLLTLLCFFVLKKNSPSLKKYYFSTQEIMYQDKNYVSQQKKNIVIFHSWTNKI